MSEPDLVWDSSEYEDSEDASWGYEFLTDSLTDFIQKIHPDGDWHCVVEGFGWRNIDGYKDFDAGDGVKLLHEVLPRTECTFKVWLDEKAKKITIDNAHHDKPTGGEMYYITPRAGKDGT